MLCRILVLAGCLLATVCHAAGHFDGKAWWHDVSVLADDRFEGRQTGSAGERAAQQYVIDQLRALGLQPAGSEGFRQPLELDSREVIESDSSLALVRGDQVTALTLGREAYFVPRVDLAPRVDARLVFVGYGLKVPELDYDDFAGLDLNGKIAVTFAGSPEAMAAPLAAHYQSLPERWKALRAAGAIGYLSIPNPASMDIPWARMSLNRSHPSMTLVGAEFADTPGASFAAVFNPDEAQRLFEGSGHSFADIAALGKTRQPLPRFDLPVSVRAVTRVSHEAIHSANVAAILPGTDPVLRKEYVVLSAHLDHLGIGEPINGDRINNGAMDNASGSALLLDLARSLKHARLKRSVLFVWVTGEEKGLLGSRFFATRPTVRADALVADLNTDMFLPIVPLRVLTVYGLAESDLGDQARAAAQRLGYRIQADPEPLRNLFVRSDQYSFIRQGVPALAMKVGADPGSAEEQALKTWLTERYHAPSDDATQPVDLATAAGFEEVMRALTVAVANAPHRPAWKSDSFFRRYAVHDH